MTAEEFIAKWSRMNLKESAASQGHFHDLCDLLGHAKPEEADPNGEWFTFEKGVTKHGGGEGWADVWKKNFFGWEYKGRHKDLDAAYDQLLQYRADLDNPPLLVMSDMDIIRIHTNFNNAPTKIYEITLRTLSEPRNLELLHNVFFSPDKLRPGVTSEAITEKASGHFAEIAQGMRERGLDPQAVAHFLVRIVFCLFAEDVGLLKSGLFKEIVAEVGEDPKEFAWQIGALFKVMSVGGRFLLKPIPHFNGSLFDATPVLELTKDEIAAIGAVAGEDWSAVDVSIFGTLFERGLNPAKRSQLGSHYTSRADIETIVEPVILAPLRHDWDGIRARSEALLAGGKKKSRPQAEKAVLAFLERLKSVRVLDPAGGSGNFLFVTLQKLLELEKGVNHYLREHGFTPQFPQVNPLQLYCIEIDPYAHDLSQTVVWIGYIQWLRANGYGFPAEPILKPLTANFRCADALFTDWQEVDFIVSNPPFLGDKMMRGELGDDYVEKLRQLFEDRIPGQSDLCCYWFEKARQLIKDGKCKRAGLLATQGIRGGLNRDVLKRIKETGNIFFAESDRPWILSGANVHVSMVGFDNGSETAHILDGKKVERINSNLTTQTDIGNALSLRDNQHLSFIGASVHGPFAISAQQAVSFLGEPNVNGLSNSDVVRPWVNAMTITSRDADLWIVDVPPQLTVEAAAWYEAPFKYLTETVLPIRKQNRRPMRVKNWWLLGDPQKAMRAALLPLARFLITPRVSKHRIFVWSTQERLTTDAAVAFAFDDDYALGVLQSRFHEIWALKLGTRLETRPRYNPSTCFETFPFPLRTPAQEAAVAAAAKELNGVRERWLNPPEWTVEKVLEFPGSLPGPWARYIVNPQPNGIGTVRYPRLEPRDAECAAKLKKRTLTNLYNERPSWLDLAHKKLDAAVAAAYGWPLDMTEGQILERLLGLNLERAAATS